jgi:hypothetical protein
VPVLALGLCGLSLLASVGISNMLPGMHDWRFHTAQLTEIGSWLGAGLPPGTVIGTYANGVLSYRVGTSMTVVDALGLTDEQIARGERDDHPGPSGHIAGDYDYVVNVRQPTLTVASGNGYSDKQRCGIDPVYARNYQVATFRREGSQNWVAVYVRSEQAATLISGLDTDPGFIYVPCPA